MISVHELQRVMAAAADLPPRVLEQLARAAIERRYDEGDTLYRAGDPGNALYIVLSGKILVERETAHRTALLHAELPGGVLGEIPVFGGGAFPATARAAEPTRCARLPIEVIERLIREEPEFSRFALRRMAVRAQSLLRRIDELTATTIVSRVAAYVARRAAQCTGQGTSNERDFTLGMSQEALAQELGTAREVVVRALASLIDAGAITRVGRSRFTVTSDALLRSIAGDLDSLRR